MTRIPVHKRGASPEAPFFLPAAGASGTVTPVDGGYTAK